MDVHSGTDRDRDPTIHENRSEKRRGEERALHWMLLGRAVYEGGREGGMGGKVGLRDFP